MTEPGIDPDIHEKRALTSLIADEIIANGGSIAFARFMELVLYHPQHGYYLQPDRKPGRKGDFITAPEASPLFGHALARQCLECWERLGSPDAWSIREYGAGIGGLAYDIMAALATFEPRAFDALTYRLVEVNPHLRLSAAEAMGQAGLGSKIVVEQAGAQPDRIVGIALANEVADALPVHRLQKSETGWLEWRVGYQDGSFSWQPGEVCPEAIPAVEYLKGQGLSVAPGDIVDVSPAASEWFGDLCSGLDRGYAIVIDYGYPAEHLYRGHRLQGTLRAYSGHTVSDDPFQLVGSRDLTAHVDFTELRVAAEAAGLVFAGFTTQGAFLSSLDLGEMLISMQQDPGARLDEYLATQAVVLRLIDPGGLGRFGVQIMARNAPVDPPLRGFRDRAPDF